MSGYREHSFDPNAGFEQSRRPMRPYDWVQWTGVGFEVAGLAAFLAYGASRMGWIPKLMESPTPVIGLCLIGTLLINSRQEPAQDIAPAQKRWMIVLTIVCIAIIGAATVIAFLGV